MCLVTSTRPSRSDMAGAAPHPAPPAQCTPPETLVFFPRFESDMDDESTFFACGLGCSSARPHSDTYESLMDLVEQLTASNDGDDDGGVEKRAISLPTDVREA